MDAKAMNFHEGEFDTILDKATLDAVLVFFDSWIVRRKLYSQRKQAHIRSVPSSHQDRSLHMRVLRPTRIPNQLLIKTRIRMDCESATSSKADNRFISLDCLGRKRVSQRALHLHLQEGRKGMIILNCIHSFL